MWYIWTMRTTQTQTEPRPRYTGLPVTTDRRANPDKDTYVGVTYSELACHYPFDPVYVLREQTQTRAQAVSRVHVTSVKYLKRTNWYRIGFKYGLRTYWREEGGAGEYVPGVVVRAGDVADVLTGVNP